MIWWRSVAGRRAGACRSRSAQEVAAIQAMGFLVFYIANAPLQVSGEAAADLAPATATSQPGGRPA